MKYIFKALEIIFIITIFFVVVTTVFITGYTNGFKNGISSVEKVSSISKPVATPTPKFQTPTSRPSVKWGGPQLWDVVNKSRVEHGVNPLKEKDELCTIASIRLNQLLELGKLDAHLGFSNMPTDRPDLKYIFDEFNISEFLVSGATSPQNAVDLWLNTLGHKKLLTGGEYVWGCIYAQNGFGVAITAY